MMLLMGSIAAEDYKYYTKPETGEKIYVNQRNHEGIEIPNDCEIWQNGCTSCGVNDGKTGMCTRVMCKYSKCLPHCSKYKDAWSIPDDCVKWFDGCNSCSIKKTNGVLQDKSQIECTSFMCSPIATQEAKCLEHYQCQVGMEEYEYIQD